MLKQNIQMGLEEVLRSKSDNFSTLLSTINVAFFPFHPCDL